MRLIDADALKEKITKDEYESAVIQGFAPQLVDTDVLLDYIDNAPTIEAKPVVHAHWKSTDKADHKPCRIKNPEKWVLCECSACGHKNVMRRNYKFCPYCGATMDEKENENED